jgi:hypothetical protein
MAVDFKACGQLLFSREVVAAAVVMAEFLLKSGGDFLIPGRITGRMSG